MHLSELKLIHVSELITMGEALEIENVARMRKQELMFAIMKKRAKAGEQVFGDGVLEVLPDGFGFLRSPDASYMASTDDIYLSPSQIRRFNLHTGDAIEGEVRVPKDGERYFALVKVDRVNGVAPEESKHKVMFENLTPLFPKEQFKLEREIKSDENVMSRIIDLIAPIGKGQRALLVAQPKTGKTVMMQQMAHALVANYPEVHLIVLLVDERPEEVTEMVRTVRGEVISSTSRLARSITISATCTWRVAGSSNVDEMTSPLTDLSMSVTSSGRSSISRTMRTTSGWLCVMLLASVCSSIVLPVRGGATMSPRCPFPIGVSISMMRAETLPCSASRTTRSWG